MTTEMVREIALLLPETVIMRLEQAAIQRHISLEGIVSELVSSLQSPFETTGDTEYDAAVNGFWNAGIEQVQAGAKAEMSARDKSRLSKLLAINRERQMTLRETAQMAALQSRGNAVALTRAAALRVLQARKAELKIHP